MACVAVAVPLIFELGPAASVTNGTSVRILGAALLALAFGAFSSAADPRHNRLVLRVEIVFGALTTGFLAYKLLTDGMQHNHALIVLPPVVVVPRAPARAVSPPARRRRAAAAVGLRAAACAAPSPARGDQYAPRFSITAGIVCSSNLMSQLRLQPVTYM